MSGLDDLRRIDFRIQRNLQNWLQFRSLTSFAEKVRFRLLYRERFSKIVSKSIVGKISRRILEIASEEVNIAIKNEETRTLACREIDATSMLRRPVASDQAVNASAD